MAEFRLHDTPARRQGALPPPDANGLTWGTIGTYRYHRDMPGGDDLYFVASSNRCCKIGRSRNVYSRIEGLQVSHSDPLVLILMLPKMGWQEIAWHHAFRHKHAHGEWFRWCPELLEAILAAWRGSDWIETLTEPGDGEPEANKKWQAQIRAIETEIFDRALARVS